MLAASSALPSWDLTTRTRGLSGTCTCSGETGALATPCAGGAVALMSAAGASGISEAGAAGAVGGAAFSAGEPAGARRVTSTHTLTSGLANAVCDTVASNRANTLVTGRFITSSSNAAQRSSHHECVASDTSLVRAITSRRLPRSATTVPMPVPHEPTRKKASLTSSKQQLWPVALALALRLLSVGTMSSSCVRRRRVTNEQSRDFGNRGLRHLEGFEWIGALSRAVAARWLQSDTDIREVLPPSPPVARERPRRFLVGTLVSDCGFRNRNTPPDQHR
jgi:hypothetical protein